MPGVTWKGILMHDLPVLICNIPVLSWQKDCQHVHFQTRNDPNVLFQLHVSGSHWKETLHSAVQTFTLI